ncbi:MAG: CPBP family intramembrane glutamic endopeptidase [Terriglobia bacterium]
MELKIYGSPPSGDRALRPAKSRWVPSWVEGFERWAAPEAETDLPQERSLLPVAALLGVALAVQYAQLGIPAVRAFLEEGDVLYRVSWAGFTIIKQWWLFVLTLLALRFREESLASLGFPRLDARRLTLAIALVVFFLGAALLRGPSYPPADAAFHWLEPLWPGERALWVLLAVTAAVVEETFFRGFAIVWTYRWSGHLPLAVLLPAAVFAAGHVYLGWLNIGFALLAALAFSLLFLWRRDLYWPMLLHFAVDSLVLLS